LGKERKAKEIKGIVMVRNNRRRINIPLMRLYLGKVRFRFIG
jgi:hypothetical protein